MREKKIAELREISNYIEHVICVLQIEADKGTEELTPTEITSWNNVWALVDEVKARD